ncbi:MAG: polyprenyl synthetase family protein [Candidatus Margulisbacteria bacterium]|nr:polyprenyl synthetase family protein [Candidatus Margulisiibacteriota bacterium]
MLKETIYAPIQSDLEAIEKIISEQLRDEPNADILAVNEFILKAPGKRLRPALMVLMFYASVLDISLISKELVRKLHQAAAAVELIHMASLIHDDIIDHAPIRHHQPSIQAKFGMEIGVVQGVYLYALSLGLLSEAGNIEVLSRISYAVKTLCQGELSQVSDRNIIREISVYMSVLEQKTGVLFAVACECGIILSGASDLFRKKGALFGEKLGVVFQIADDYMDFMGDEKTLGKDPGQDFELGEMTLPVLLLLDSAKSEEERIEIEMLMSDSRSDEALLKLRDRVYASQALYQTKEIAVAYLEKAEGCLEGFSDTIYKTSLEVLLGFVEQRAFASHV